jgi:ABC-2 type transport system permease protein
MVLGTSSRDTDGSTVASTAAATTIARLSARKSVRAGIGWGVVFGFYVATQALTYATSYKTVASRHLLVQEFAHNAGISALVGPAIGIDTVPGFTSWKCLTVLAIMGAVWGILTSTRLTRGEEDAGRWEILLAGPVTRRGAAQQALTGMAAGALALFVSTSIIVAAVGRSSKVDIGASSAVFFSLAVASGALMFLAIGSLCAQLSTSRRQAISFASFILGASYAIRMVADSGSGLSWLHWLTPLGWIEELRPLTSPRPWVLAPIAVSIVVVGTATIVLAGRRDLGAGTLGDRSTLSSLRRLPSTTRGIAVFLSRGTLLAWGGSIVAYGLLLGSIAKSGGKIITASPSLRADFARLGISGAEAYLSVAYLIMALTLSFVAVGQVNAARKEESNGQLENLLVRPYSRIRWLTQRIALATLVLALGGALAGVSTWVGAVSDHADVRLTSLFDAGINVAVPALLIFGIGVLAFGVVPRMVSAVTYGLLVWFLLVEILGSVVSANHWILDLSGYHQMAAAPAVAVNWSANAVMIALALGAAGLGLIAFNRRDVQYE